MGNCAIPALTLTRHGQLDGEQLGELQVLTRRCEAADGVEHDLGWEILLQPDNGSMTCRIYRDEVDGALVAASITFGYAPGELEMAALVAPELRRRGVFRRMVADLREDSLLLVVTRGCTPGEAAVASLGAVLERTEYRMVHSGDAQTALHGGVGSVEHGAAGAALRLAEVAELDDIVRDDLVSFGSPPEDEEHVRTLMARRFEAPECDVYRIVTCGPQPVTVGQLVLSYEAENPFIYGLAVLPEHQRRGYGRAALAAAVAAARRRTSKPVKLEVDVDNPKALDVYHASGFVTTTTFDYYRLAGEARKD